MQYDISLATKHWKSSLISTGVIGIHLQIGIRAETCGLDDAFYPADLVQVHIPNLLSR